MTLRSTIALQSSHSLALNLKCLENATTNSASIIYFVVIHSLQKLNSMSGFTCLALQQLWFCEYYCAHVCLLTESSKTGTMQVYIDIRVIKSSGLYVMVSEVVFAHKSM